MMGSIEKVPKQPKKRGGDMGRAASKGNFSRIGQYFGDALLFSKSFLCLLSGVWLLSPVLGYSKSADLTHLSLEQLMEVRIGTVRTASRYEQKTTRAPSSVQIITSEQIQKYGYRTLADILRSVRGFYVSYDRNYSFLGVRGFSRPGDYNSRVLLLVDSHRINDALYDQATIGTDFILDVDLIDRVEIVPGPGSSIYGSNAFFAVINVITRKGRDVSGLEASGEVGSFRTARGRLSYGNQFKNGAEVLLSGTAYESKGARSLYYAEYDDPDTNNGYAENRDGDRFYSLFSTLSFGDLTLQGAYVTREKHVPTGSYGVAFNDPQNRTRDDRWYLDLIWQGRVTDDFDLQARLFYDDYRYDGTYVYDSVRNQDRSLTNWAGSEVTLTSSSFENHKIMAGAEFRKNFRQDQWNYDEDPYILYLNDKRDSTVWALYIQDEFDMTENLILNLGLRYDHYSTFGETLNPRCALIYNPFEMTFFKLIYGQAFRPPNSYEAFYEDGGIFSKANPDLQPETIRTYELVWEQFFGAYLHGSVSLFYYRIKNLIEHHFDPADDLLVFMNTGSAKARGVELQLAGQLDNGLEGRINYAYQDAKDDVTGLTLTNSPQHMANLNLVVPLYQRNTFAGIELQYKGSRKTLAGNDAPRFFLANLTLMHREIIKGLTASASVYNLFNKHYSDPGAGEHLQDLLSQDGRSFRLKLTYRF
jgi:iron complex outermembrane receptor protein